MDKSFLDVAAFTPLLNRFLRQKNSLRFGEKRKKGGRTRKPPFGFTVFKGSGRQYCMQSIPLAVLKHAHLYHSSSDASLHAVHTACGIETSKRNMRDHQNAPLHAVHTACGIETYWTLITQIFPLHCMQSIPLAVFFYFPLLFFKRRIFLWHNEAITKMFCWEG